MQSPHIGSRGDAVTDRSRSLGYQASCIREQLHKEADPEKRAGLEGAIKTIEKVNAARDPIRAVLSIFEVFPGTEVRVRRIDDEDRDE